MTHLPISSSIEVAKYTHMNEDKIIQHIIEIKEQMGRLDEKMGRFITREEYLKHQDETMAILKRLDQERIFTIEWVRRIENDLEKVKQQLQIT